MGAIQEYKIVQFCLVGHVDSKPGISNTTLTLGSPRGTDWPLLPPLLMHTAPRHLMLKPFQLQLELLHQKPNKGRQLLM